MNQYTFNMMGLGVALTAPFPIQISENLQPFLCSCAERVDCAIRIVVGPLPQPGLNGKWYGLEYCETAADRKRTFHCHKPYEEPFALTEMDCKGDIKITVCPDCGSYFSGTSGIFNRIGFENLLLQHNGLLLHASLIKYVHRGIAFTGPSGIGKSTQADLWRRSLGAEILNGDRAALRNTSDRWMAYGSPYAGTSGIYRNEHVPLAAIVVLEQGKKNSLRRLSGAEAIGHIWPEISARRWDAEFVTAAASLCAQLLTDTPVYLLECLPEESAVTLLKEGLSL